MFGKKKIFGHNNLFGQLALLLIQLEFLTFFSTDRTQDTGYNSYWGQPRGPALKIK